MKLIIKKPNIKNLNSEGIPKSFADIKKYFNKAIQENTIPWIPRKTPITNKEIRELWIPSLNTNITLHAKLNGKVVGSLTVFYSPKSSSYKYASERIIGNIGMSINPQEDYDAITTKLIQELIKILKNQKKIAIWSIAKESSANKILKELGYKKKLIKNQKRYMQIGLSGDIFEYKLPN